MKNSNKVSAALLLKKECSLTASILSYLFIAFAVMTLIPGYPILVGSFFVCLGLFQSYQAGRENNDILYTVLLPVSKADAVRAKYLFAVMIELSAFALCLVFTIIRMTLWKSAPVFVNNAMMNANGAYLGYVLLVFALFNAIFIRGYFKTAYYFSKPFIGFIVFSFLLVMIVEALHHFPGLQWLNSCDAMGDYRHWLIFALCVVIYAAATVLSCKAAQKSFEKIDL